MAQIASLDPSGCSDMRLSQGFDLEHDLEGRRCCISPVFPDFKVWTRDVALLFHWSEATNTLFLRSIGIRDDIEPGGTEIFVLEGHGLEHSGAFNNMTRQQTY